MAHDKVARLKRQQLGKVWFQVGYTGVFRFAFGGHTNNGASNCQFHALLVPGHIVAK